MWEIATPACALVRNDIGKTKGIAPQGHFFARSAQGATTPCALILNDRQLNDIGHNRVAFLLITESKALSMCFAYTGQYRMCNKRCHYKKVYHAGFYFLY